MSDEFEYDAFISYSHSDRDVAEELYKRLTSYRTPNALRRKLEARREHITAKLCVFMDRQSLEAGSNLSERLRARVSASKWLIVICSKQSKKSASVNKEIKWFLDARDSEKIIPILHRHTDTTRSKELWPPALEKLAEKPACPDILLDGGMMPVRNKILGAILGASQSDIASAQEKEDERARRRSLAIFAGGCGLTLLALAGVFIALLSTDEAASQRSRLFAQQANELNRRNIGMHDKALLFALMADPVNGKRILPRARNTLAEAELMRAFVNSSLAIELGEPSDKLNTLEFHPDGKRLFAGSEKGQLFVWEFMRKENVESPLNQHSRDAIQEIAFNPTGELIALGTKGGTTEIWDLTSNERVTVIKDEPEHDLCVHRDIKPTGYEMRSERIYRHHLKIYCEEPAPIVSLAFSPIGDYILTGSQNGNVKLWHVSTGRHIKDFKFTHSNQYLGVKPRVHSAGFNNNGDLVIASTNHEVAIWEVFSNRMFLNSRSVSEAKSLDYSRGATQASLSSDERSVFAFNRNRRTIQLWDVRSGRQYFSLTNDGETPLAQLMPDGISIVSAETTLSSAGKIDVVRIRTPNRHSPENEFTTRTIGSIGDGVEALAVSANGNLISTVSKKNRVTIWKIAGMATVDVLSPDTNLYNAETVNADKTRIISERPKLYRPMVEDYSGCKYHRIRKIVVSDGAKDQYIFSNVSDGEPDALEDTFPPEVIVRLDGKRIRQGTDYSARMGVGSAGKDVVISFKQAPKRNSTVELCLDRDYETTIIDLASDSAVEAFLHDKSVSIAAFGPNELSILTRDKNSIIRLLDIDSGKEIQSLSGYDNFIVSPDGSSIITKSGEGIATLWDAKLERRIQSFSFSEFGEALAYSNSGQSLLFSSIEGIEIINTRDLDFRRRRLTFPPNMGNAERVKKVTSVQEFDVERVPSMSFRRSRKMRTTSAKFSHDDKKIITVSHGNVISLWDADSGSRKWSVSVEESIPYSQILFSPNERLAAIFDSQWLYLIHTDSGKVIWEFGNNLEFPITLSWFDHVGNLVLLSKLRNRESLELITLPTGKLDLSMKEFVGQVCEYIEQSGIAGWTANDRKSFLLLDGKPDIPAVCT